VASKLDAQIDELYQLPLDQFTDRRNAFAKELSGDARAQVKSLVKPSSAMWAINQLFWRDRPTYNALVSAAETLRSAHRALLSGRKADLRKPEAVHKAAVERAIVKTTAIARSSDGELSGAALDIIRRTIVALPTDEPPGRLTRPPDPVGFSLLTGVKPRTIQEPGRRSPIAPRKGAVDSAVAAKAADKGRKQAEHAEKQRVREEAARRRVEAAAERKLARARAVNERRLESARKAADRAAAQLREAERRVQELEASKTP
jgi:hypothetical protein